MIPSSLLLGQISERMESIGGHFRRGGSTWSVLIVLLLLALVVAIAYLLTRAQRPASTDSVRADPQRLFADLMRELGLTHPQRRFLTSVARARKLDHPSAILLSSALFEQAVYRSARDSGEQNELVPQLRRVLFPGQ